MSTRDVIKRAEEEYDAGGSSEMFQFKKSGKYQIRLLTEPVELATHFFGKGQPSAVCFGKKKGCPFHGEHDKKPTLKFVVYLIDRATGKISLGEIPYSVVKAVGDFEEDEEYTFEGYPMPYDIRVVVDKENADPGEIYKTIAGRTVSEITEQERGDLAGLLGKITPESFVERRKEKAAIKIGTERVVDEKQVDYPSEENPEDISF